jgi:hypothetical protein
VDNEHLSCSVRLSTTQHHIMDGRVHCTVLDVGLVLKPLNMSFSTPIVVVLILCENDPLVLYFEYKVTFVL